MVLPQFCIVELTPVNCILLLRELSLWHPPAYICTKQAGLEFPTCIQCIVFFVTCISLHCPIVFGRMRGMQGTMIVSWRAPKSPRSPRVSPPSRSHAGLFGGGGGAQGFPSPELVLTARCQGEIPTDAPTVRARGVQPAQRTLVSSQCRRHHYQISILVISHKS